jgi:hypothetical protein
MEKGYYDFIGNTARYDGGQYAIDLDSRERIPREVLAMLGDYIGTELNTGDSYELTKY